MFRPEDSVLSTKETEFNLSCLTGILHSAANAVKSALSAIKESTSSISISDMFEMQLIMNQFTQLSEMTTNVASAAHQAVNTMARNVKG